MASQYLIIDETIRRMASVLRPLVGGRLENERERRGAYRDAGVDRSDMDLFDAEALRCERIRRRLFDLPIVSRAA